MTWPRGRALHGGVDRIPLPAGVAGRLWLCGKHYIGPDPEAALRSVGATVVACLNEQAELSSRYPEYVTWLRDNQPERAIWWPVPDLHAPGPDDAAALLGELCGRLDAGGSVLMHCGAGIGRAGTMACAVLLRYGLPLDDAVAQVAASRPMAGPEAGAQRDLLEALAAR